jgi:hypothetical protein
LGLTEIRRQGDRYSLRPSNAPLKMLAHQRERGQGIEPVPPSLPHTIRAKMRQEIQACHMG